MDRSVGNGGLIPVRAPVDKLRLGDREADTQPGPFDLQPRVMPLQDSDVASIGGRGRGQTEIVHVGEREATGDLRVEAGNLNDKQKRGDWGALGRAHRDRGEHLGRSLV